MNYDIKGLETWAGEAREWQRKAGRMKTRGGIGMVDAVASHYAEWTKSKSTKSQKQYMLWRLRLHLKHNVDQVFLQELNEMFDLGLYDEEIGPTYWDIAPQINVEHRSQGFNWRKDSGDAIRGGSGNKTLTSEQREFTEPTNKQN